MIRPGRETLTGTVEVDETIIGGVRRGRIGRADRPLAVIAAEVRGAAIGRIRLQRVDKPSRENLIGFVKKNVAPGSVVITDGSWGYDGVAEKGFDHRFTVLKGKGKQAGNIVLPRVHRVAALLKRWILGVHHGRVSGEKLDHYFDEFTFRFNRRGSLRCVFRPNPATVSDQIQPASRRKSSHAGSVATLSFFVV
jgi:transposase-like protein